MFENNEDPDKYHGYSIQNYFDIDPRFGTKQDLIELVEEAHRLEMRVFLDVVINHSGDNWYYPNNVSYKYFNDMQFPLEGWRRNDRPIPIELRNPDYYHRWGEIQDNGWDAYPQTQNGDFFSLKDFNNDDNPAGLELLNVLIKAHCYWMREADIDGFRMDAVKHMGALAVSRFCSQIREYAYQLGKRWFFLYGELVDGDDAINRYIGPNTPVDGKNIYFDLNSVLDFPLDWTLPGAIKGLSAPAGLINRYEAQGERALSRGELGRYLVTFVDNHDQIGQDFKRRFAADTPDEQVIAGIGYLLCALGTPCIYYGTEQGFSGQGHGDELIREAMFDLGDPERNLLNQNCFIYQEISKIAHLFQQIEALRFGRMYFREISGNGRDFGLPQGQPCTLAFSRILAEEEILIAYNTSTSEQRQDFVMVDNKLHKAGDSLKFLYGKEGAVSVAQHPDLNNSSLFV